MSLSINSNLQKQNIVNKYLQSIRVRKELGNLKSKRVQPDAKKLKTLQKVSEPVSQIQFYNFDINLKPDSNYNKRDDYKLAKKVYKLASLIDTQASIHFTDPENETNPSEVKMNIRFELPLDINSHDHTKLFGLLNRNKNTNFNKFREDIDQVTEEITLAKLTDLLPRNDYTLELTNTSNQYVKELNFNFNTEVNQDELNKFKEVIEKAIVYLSHTETINPSHIKENITKSDTQVQKDNKSHIKIAVADYSLDGKGSDQIQRLVNRLKEVSTENNKSLNLQFQ